MPVITGNLADIKLIDILELIHHSRLTGKLELNHGEDKGEIYFSKGNVVHAVTGSVEGKDALFLMYLWNEGTFEFSPNVEAPKTTINEDIESIILDLSVKLDELQDIKEALDPFAVPVFTEGASAANEELKLSATEWKILAQIDGKSRIKDIAAKLGISEIEVFKAIKRLISLGLVKVQKFRSPDEVADKRLMDEIMKKFTEYIGPISGIIMSEKIMQLGEKESAFPKNKIPQLIELLAQEVPEESRAKFKKELAEIASKYGL